MLSHSEAKTTTNTVLTLGLKIVGTMDECESYGKAKAKRKKMRKETGTGSKKTGEILCMGISSVKDKSYGGSKN